jgi:hypothetical protein
MTSQCRCLAMAIVYCCMKKIVGSTVWYANIRKYIFIDNILSNSSAQFEHRPMIVHP